MAAVLTAKGRDMSTALWKVTGTEPKIIGWGTGGVAGGPFTAAVTDVNAFQEASEARVTGTSSQVTTTTTNDTYQVTGTFTAGGAKTIAEVFLTDSATKPFNTTVAAGASTVIGSATNTAMNVSASYTPANNTFVQVRTEVMQVTAGTGTTALTVTRGANGSTAISSIAAGDSVTTGNPPGSSNQVTGGNMFIHADHGSTTLATNDQIAYTIQVKQT